MRYRTCPLCSWLDPRVSGCRTLGVSGLVQASWWAELDSRLSSRRSLGAPGLVCLPLGMWGQSPKGPLGLLVDGLGPDMADCRAMVVLRLSTSPQAGGLDRGPMDLRTWIHPLILVLVSAPRGWSQMLVLCCITYVSQNWCWQAGRWGQVQEVLGLVSAHWKVRVNCLSVFQYRQSYK